MKNTVQILVLALAFSACQQTQRYTQQSAEIDAVKALLKTYESGDFEGQRLFYAENAEIFYNVPESNPSTVDQLLEQQKLELADFSNLSIEFDDDAIEMVTTDKGEIWVNVWAEWKGTLKATGKEFIIPTHETFQFVDGKIVKDFGYWDNSSIMAAFMELEAAEKAAADSLPK